MTGYKRSVHLPFFNLHIAHKLGPEGPIEDAIPYCIRSSGYTTAARNRKSTLPIHDDNGGRDSDGNGEHQRDYVGTKEGVTFAVVGPFNPKIMKRFSKEHVMDDMEPI